MIRGPRSLLTRILLWHGIAVVVTAVAVSAGVYLFLNATADHFERQTLRAQVAAIRDQVIVRPDGSVEVAASGVSGPGLAAGMDVLVVDAERVIADAASATPSRTVPRIPRRGSETYFTRRSRSSFYAGLSVPVMQGGRRLWIVALQNLDHPANVIDDLVRQLLWRGLLIVSPLLLLLLGIDALIVRRALRPVRRASALVGTIDASQPDKRVIDPAIPTEVRPLADAINSALDRLTDSVQMTREFTADAAHELRTPITVARVRATEIEDPVLRSALIADLDRLAGTVGHLLDLAELETAGKFATEPVDLAKVARDCIAAVAPLAFRQKKPLELVGGERPNIVPGQPQFLSRALAALLENAVRHTPTGTEITVSVNVPGIVSVTDDGPGISDADQEFVFRRFWRGGVVSGSGLGLAIVQRIAAMHQGSIALKSRPGKTVFTLSLPEERRCCH